MAGNVDYRSLCEKRRQLDQSHAKMRLSIGITLHVASDKKVGNTMALFAFRAMLAQKLDDPLIALFLRLIQRRFPLRVLRVHVRFLI
jgi:hypothetical protein